jgi:transcriptional regulator with XRE-family HTH domain
MNYLDEEYNLAISKVLQKLRENKGYSFEELAKKINYQVTRQTLQRYEKKGVRLKNSIWLEICKALDITPQDFITEVYKLLNEKK